MIQLNHSTLRYLSKKTENICSFKHWSINSLISFIHISTYYTTKILFLLTILVTQNLGLIKHFSNSQSASDRSPTIQINFILFHYSAEIV